MTHRTPKFQLAALFVALLVAAATLCCAADQAKASDPIPVAASARHLILRGAEERTAGDLAQAAKSYSAAISSADATPYIQQLARVELLAISLAEDPPELDVAEKQLKELREGAKDRASSSFWDYAIQLHLLRLKAAAPADRAKLWETGIQTLIVPSEHPMSGQSITCLAALVTALRDNKSLEPQKVLADMMLLLPDLDAMRQIQWIRSAEFARAHDAEGLRSVVTLDAALASASVDGPADAFRRGASVANDAGMQSLANEFKPTFSSAMHWSPDAMLKQEAEHELADQSSSAPRRQVWLNALAGRPVDAAIMLGLFSVHIRETLNRRAFNESFAIMTLTTGKVENGADFAAAVFNQSQSTTAPSIRATTRVATSTSAPAVAVQQSQKLATRPANVLLVNASTFHQADAAHEAIKHWDSYATHWIKDACASNDMKSAAAIAALAVNRAVRSEDATNFLDGLTRRLDENAVLESPATTQSAEEDPKTIALLHDAVPLVKTPQRKRLVLVHMAQDYFDTGDFEASLKALDEADATYIPPNRSESQAAGYTRVMSLLRLNRLEDAQRQIAEIEKWPGTDEERARLGFLKGWMYLQSNDQSEGTYVLAGVVDRYPTTSFAVKARQLLRNLRSSEAAPKETKDK